MLSRLGFKKKNATNKNTTKKKSFFSSLPKNYHYIVESVDDDEKNKNLKSYKVRKNKGTNLNKGVRSNYKISAKGYKESLWGDGEEELKNVTLVESTSNWLKRHTLSTMRGLKTAAYIGTKETGRIISDIPVVGSVAGLAKTVVGTPLSYISKKTGVTGALTGMSKRTNSLLKQKKRYGGSTRKLKKNRFHKYH